MLHLGQLSTENLRKYLLLIPIFLPQILDSCLIGLKKRLGDEHGYQPKKPFFSLKRYSESNGLGA